LERESLQLRTSSTADLNREKPHENTKKDRESYSKKETRIEREIQLALMQ
jgi:hypothetical protein